MMWMVAVVVVVVDVVVAIVVVVVVVGVDVVVVVVVVVLHVGECSVEKNPSASFSEEFQQIIQRIRCPNRIGIRVDGAMPFTQASALVMQLNPPKKVCEIL